MKTIKCQPPKSPYHISDFSVCTEPNTFDPLFMENVNDIADTLAEIMIVCGIHRCKAKSSRRIVVQAFQFYDIKRHRFETADSEGSICRSDIVQDFEQHCSMTRIEALLAYCIVKRAIKAFYHGTADHSLRSPAIEAVILKEQEFVWLHAARRTITIFERYEQMFYESQLNYASQIMKIYKELHQRLRRRADPVMLEDYHPRGCVQKVVIGTRSPPKQENDKHICVDACKKSQQLREYIDNLPPKVFPLKTCLTLPSPCPLLCDNERDVDELSEDSPPPKKKKVVKNMDLNLPRCFQCNCPQIICDCDIDPDTGVVAIDCTQGPFECQWVRMDRRDPDDPCIEKPELHQCPVDCTTSESSNDSESTEYCECSAESNKDDDDDEDENGKNDYDEDNIKMSKNYDSVISPNSEKELEHTMPKNLPRNKNFRECEMRAISKLPMLKCITATPVTRNISKKNSRS